MISLAQARRFVLERVTVLDPVTMPLAEALGCVAAEAIVATEPVPPFANTAMDGFAVRARDTVGAGTAPVRLELVGTLAAGSAFAGEIGPGQALRIMTGAPMPAGADAVVMVERTALVPAVAGDDGGVEAVLIGAPARPGDHVRPVGDDFGAGQQVLDVGVVLTPGHLGVLASVGAADIAVVPRCRVGVLSTGDELVDDGRALRPGQVRDSNRRILLALAAESGFEPMDLGLVGDDAATIAEAIEHGVASCDALVTSGGVSMGDFDEVKGVLGRMSQDMAWMQVAIRPAKPLAFGTIAGVPVFGLPGNPVSSLVSFELFARPALRLRSGHRHLDRLRLPAETAEAFSRRPDGKTHFVRVVIGAGDSGRFYVRSAGGQGSHHLAAMAAANGLMTLPDGDGARAGDQVEVMVLGEIDPWSPGPGS